jgi:soluble lytic murein transglycosylase-like protein
MTFPKPIALATAALLAAFAASPARADAKAAAAPQTDELTPQIVAALATLGLENAPVADVFRERVRVHLDRWLHRQDLRQILARKQARWPMVMRELAARGLPPGMGYIAWAESHYLDDVKQSPTNRSAGLWQFIPETARRYGLLVDAKTDERLDPEKSTRAAAAYLAELVADFGHDSALLAIASYNLGELRMRKVLRGLAGEPGGLARSQRDFWHLYEKKLLPEETAEYVPAIVAAAIVGENAKRYGLE